MTHKIKRYRQAGGTQINNRLYLTIEADEWEPLVEWIPLLSLDETTDGLTCDFCAAGEAGERYSIISEDIVITFEIDAGESVPELDEFLTTMRDLLDDSSDYAQGVWTIRN